jgi:hypothetical protein
LIAIQAARRTSSRPYLAPVLSCGKAGKREYSC